MVEEFDPAQFKKLLDENNKPKKSRPAASPPGTKARLVEYNKVLAKRRRRQEWHDAFIDVMVVGAFLMIAYVAFLK